MAKEKTSVRKLMGEGNLVVEREGRVVDYEELSEMSGGELEDYGIRLFDAPVVFNRWVDRSGTVKEEKLSFGYDNLAVGGADLHGSAVDNLESVCLFRDAFLSGKG